MGVLPIGSAGEKGVQKVNKTIKYVYVAGPYISHPHHNTKAAIDVADQLVEMGLVPIVPHLSSSVWNVVTPRPESFWLKYTMTLLKLCDAVIRFPGESKGADNEVREAIKLGIPVFYSIGGLQEALTALQGA